GAPAGPAASRTKTVPRPGRSSRLPAGMSTAKCSSARSRRSRPVAFGARWLRLVLVLDPNMSLLPPARLGSVRWSVETDLSRGGLNRVRDQLEHGRETGPAPWLDRSTRELRSPRALSADRRGA